MYFKKNNLLVKLHLAFSISFLMKMPTGVFDPETNVWKRRPTVKVEFAILCRQVSLHFNGGIQNGTDDDS